MRLARKLGGKAEPRRRVALVRSMSLGYAQLLTPREDLGGQIGAKEYFDNPDVIQTNVKTLADWVRALSK